MLQKYRNLQDYIHSLSIKKNHMQWKQINLTLVHYLEHKHLEWHLFREKCFFLSLYFSGNLMESCTMHLQARDQDPLWTRIINYRITKPYGSMIRSSSAIIRRFCEIVQNPTRRRTTKNFCTAWLTMRRTWTCKL